MKVSFQGPRDRQRSVVRQLPSGLRINFKRNRAVDLGRESVAESYRQAPGALRNLEAITR